MEDDNEKFIKDEEKENEKEKEREEINEIKEYNKSKNGENENNNLLLKNDKDNVEASIGLKNGNNEKDKNNLINNENDINENKINNNNIEEDKNPLIEKDNENNENSIKNGNNIENNEKDLIIGDYIITIQYTKLFHIPYFKFGNIVNFYFPCYKFKSAEINLSEMPTPPFGIVTSQCKIFY